MWSCCGFTAVVRVAVLMRLSEWLFSCSVCPSGGFTAVVPVFARGLLVDFAGLYFLRVFMVDPSVF